MGASHLFVNGLALGAFVLGVVVVAAVIVIAIALVTRASRGNRPEKH